MTARTGTTAFLLLGFALALSSTGTVLAADPTIERRVDSLLQQMTLTEKLGQLNQIAGEGSGVPGQRTTSAQLDLVRRGNVGSFLNVVGAAETRRIQRVAVEESRLHIPLLFGLDVIHGYRTTFPIPLAEASTWDPALIEGAARIAATEATASGIHWTFAPMVDIARDPRWGRIAEGSGEDPFLGSAMAAARVRGFQGKRLDDPASLLACAKHFAAYGAAEGGRDYNTVDLSERTVREVYLAPFHAAVQAGAATLMCSFNEINGVPSSANRWLLTDVLRGEWGFEGFVVSDWNSIGELQAHGVAATRTDAGILGLESGVDMDMMSGIYAGEMVQAAAAGRVATRTVDDAVRRVLRMKFAMGLFDNPYRGCDTVREQSALLSRDNLRATRDVAARSIVLLQNRGNLLPLPKDNRTLAVIGPLGDDRQELLGPWAAEGRPGDVVTVLEGIKNQVSPGSHILHATGCRITGDSLLDIAGAVRVARNADVVVLVLGEAAEMSGEAASRSVLDLPGKQKDLLQAIHLLGKPVVLVLMNGRPLTLVAETESADAILEAWFPGVQGGNAVADVLFGAVNPGAKLPVSFPRSVGQLPVYYGRKNTGRPFSAEDHYTSKYVDVPNTPLFPFGFGLSYTTFAYSGLKVEPPVVAPDGVVKVTVTVSNTGKRAGTEVAQLYVCDDVASITRPVKELKGFSTIALRPGESTPVEFLIPARELGFLDGTMHYGVEPGTFHVFVGGNSVDCLQEQFEVVRR
jgi:beta-glucosidase